MLQNKNQNLDLIKRVQQLIFLSVALTKEEKESLSLKLPTFTVDRIEKIAAVFEKVQEIKNKMLLKRFQEDPDLAERYGEQIKKGTKQSFSKAEKKRKEEQNPEDVLEKLQHLP